MLVTAVKFIVAATELDAFPSAKYTDPFVDVILVVALPIVENMDEPVTFESMVKMISEAEDSDEELKINDGEASEKALAACELTVESVKSICTSENAHVTPK